MNETLSFRVDGEGLTRLVRDILLSEEPSKAMRTIVEGLSGEGIEEIAEKVLRGELRFTGSSADPEGLGVEEDPDSERFRRDARYIYAGRVQLPGQDGWWRPRTVVRPVDSEGAELPRRPIAGPVRYSEWSERGDVPEEYDSILVPIEGPGSGIVDFERVGEPPPWFRDNATPQQAYEDARREGRRIRTDDYLGPIPTYEEIRQAECEKRSALAREKFGEIRARAGDAYEEIRIEGGNPVARVPRAALSHYAFRGTSLAQFAEPWAPVSASGWKMGGDNPFHTDCYLGAVDLEGNPIAPAAELRGGFDYDGEFQSALSDTRFRLQRERGNFECTVLSGGSARSIFGIVGREIAVLPNLHPDYLPKMLAAKVTIAAVGGRTAHLAQVALDANYPLVLVPGAVTRFPEGSKLEVDVVSGTVRFVGI